MSKKLAPNDKLIAAAKHGSALALAAALIDGADANARCAHGVPALNWLAGDAGRAAAVSWFIAQGANPRLANPDGCTALMFAADGADPATLAALVEGGADLAARDNCGRSALDYAVEADLAKNAAALRALGERAEIEAVATPDEPTAAGPLVAAASAAPRAALRL